MWIYCCFNNTYTHSAHKRRTLQKFMTIIPLIWSPKLYWEHNFSYVCCCFFFCFPPNGINVKFVFFWYLTMTHRIMGLKYSSGGLCHCRSLWPLVVVLERCCANNTPATKTTKKGNGSCKEKQRIEWNACQTNNPWSIILPFPAPSTRKSQSMMAIIWGSIYPAVC